MRKNGSILISLIILAALGFALYVGVTTILSSREAEQVKTQAEEVIDKSQGAKEQLDQRQDKANQIIEQGKETIKLN